jgi:fumarate reductase flavoprotein subunit
MTETLYQAAKNLGTKFLFNTRAKKLITNDRNEVVGVEAKTKDNKRITIMADAVIMAEGGFWGASAGAFDKDIPAHLKDVIIAAEGSYAQGGKGDGSRMAKAIGAKLNNMRYLEYTAQRYLDGKGNLCPIHGSDTIWSRGASIILNQDLERFLNEDLCFAKETLSDEIAHELMKRHEKWYWNIWDEVSKENTYRIRFWISQGFIEDGFILVGKTIDELAQQMEVDAVELKETVSLYNSYFAEGLSKDPQFGRDLKREGAHPLNTPPFYALRAGIQCNNRRGGIDFDKETHALRKDGSTIPGFYVAGSSMDSVKFDGVSWLSGTGLASCLVWGRIAGKNAALGL